MPKIIEHSGLAFMLLGHTIANVSIWPIAEYLVRTKHKPKVAARIRRLNPKGKAEGDMPRGYHPSYFFKHSGKRAKK